MARPPEPDGHGVSVAVIGCGHWGGNLVRNFGALGSLVAVCDEDLDRRAAAAQGADVPAMDLGQVVAAPDIDAVAIATPASTHAELAIQMLEAGKHVFVEKPLALRVEEALKVVAAAVQADRTLMVGHLLNYHPAFRELVRRVHGGELGRVQYLYSNRLNFGRFRQEEDILWSFAPHDISMILRLVGAEPVSVSAVASTHLHATIADVTTTHMSFPGGQGAHIHVSWLHPVKEQRLVVVGDRGMAVFDDGQPWESKLVLYRHEVAWERGLPVPSRGEPEPVPVDPAEPLALECEHFLRCVAEGSTPETDGAEGIRVLQVLERARESLAGTSVVAPQAVGAGSTVHPTVTVDEDVEIGDGAKVWHYSHVLPGSRIGPNCVLGQNVMVGPNVNVGRDCRIQNNVSVYEGVTLEDGVFCGPSVVFTNVTNPRAGIDRRDEFRPTLVQRGTTIGANATIVCGVTLGAYSFVGAGAVVTRDVAPHALVVGNPAQQVGWVSHAGERLTDELACPRTGQRYRLTDDGLLPDD